MTQTLEQLSAAATQGEWISIQSSINPDRHYITNEHHAIFVSEIGGTKPADLKFVTSLVNLYRTGQLVAVQPDDATVERVKDAIGTSLAYDIGMDVRAGSLTDDEKRKVARKAIAAMEGPKP